MSHFSSQFMSVIRRFHGSRCIVSNMNNGRDINTTNQLINEINRQKLELRIIELENTVKQLCETINKIDRVIQKFNKDPDYKHVN